MTVEEILSIIKNDGDRAIRSFSEKFDKLLIASDPNKKKNSPPPRPNHDCHFPSNFEIWLSTGKYFVSKKWCVF